MHPYFLNAVIISAIVPLVGFSLMDPRMADRLSRMPRSVQQQLEQENNQYWVRIPGNPDLMSFPLLPVTPRIPPPEFLARPSSDFHEQIFLSQADSTEVRNTFYSAEDRAQTRIFRGEKWEVPLNAEQRSMELIIVNPEDDDNPQFNLDDLYVSNPLAKGDPYTTKSVTLIDGLNGKDLLILSE